MGDSRKKRGTASKECAALPLSHRSPPKSPKSAASYSTKEKVRMRSVSINNGHHHHQSSQYQDYRYHHSQYPGYAHSTGSINGGYPSPPLISSSLYTSPLTLSQLESPLLTSSSYGSSSYTPSSYSSPTFTSSSTFNVSPTLLTTITMQVGSIFPSESEPSLRFVASYTKDLPSLSEVKAACDCYVDECGDRGTSFQLCYVNRGQLEEIWLHLCSMQISKVELALLYGVLASVGIGTPAGHQTKFANSLPSIRSRHNQMKFIKNAMEILERETSMNDDDDEEESSVLFTRCQALALIAWYHHQNQGGEELAWKFIKESVKAAHTCHLFQLNEWESATPAKLHTVKILQMDIPYMFHWISYHHSQGEDDDCCFETNFSRPSNTLMQINDAPLDQSRLRHKVEGSALARSILIQSNRASKGIMSRKELINLAFQLDGEILQYIDSHYILRTIPSIKSLSIADDNEDNQVSLRLVESIVIFRGEMMLLRYRLMLTLFKLQPLDLFQQLSLSSARTTLQMLSLVDHCFDLTNRPFSSQIIQSCLDGFFNECMFVFLKAIRSHLYDCPSSDQEGENDGEGDDDDDNNHYPNTTHSESVRAELVWFMSNFNQLKQSMTRLGFIKEALVDCAKELQMTPVQRPAQEQSTTTTTTKHRRHTSATPIVQVVSTADHIAKQN